MPMSYFINGCVFLLGLILGIVAGVFYLRPITIGEYFSYQKNGEEIWGKIENFSKVSGNFPEDLNELIDKKILNEEQLAVLNKKKLGYSIFSYESGKLSLYHQPGTFGGLTVWPHDPEDTTIRVKVAR